jgi:hypothetical protein
MCSFERVSGEYIMVRCTMLVWLLFVTNLKVRCTLFWQSDFTFGYKYCGALHLKVAAAQRNLL